MITTSTVKYFRSVRIAAHRIANPARMISEASQTTEIAGM